MKKIIIIIAMIFAIIELKSQDSQPDGLFFQMNKNSSTFTKQIDIADFQQNHFILGWQWGGHPNLTAALKMNMSENHPPSWGTMSPNNSGSPINYIWQMKDWINGYVPHLCAVSFIYKPTLNFDANMNVINSTDPDHNIFGFRVKDPNLVNIDNKLLLDKYLYDNNIYTNPVLQKPWSNDRYKSSN